MKQNGVFRGVYEFEDASGGLIAAKVPLSGTADLYDGTVIIVKPNQRAFFIYEGKITDILKPGTHEVSTKNVPVLTRLSNWEFGFNSPLRCEIWFFSGNLHTSKKWGTRSPVINDFNSVGAIPIRAYGSYNVGVSSPSKLYKNLVGSRNFLDITQVEEFVQGQLLENLPQALKIVDEVVDLSKRQDDVSKELEKIMKKELAAYGLRIKNVQIQSLLPPPEIMEAFETRVAMDLIGDQKNYLMYKAANSLGELGAGGSGGDPMQMMMGLMLGKDLMLEGSETSSPPKRKLSIGSKQKSSAVASKFCTSCGESLATEYKFCFVCGAKQ